MKITTNRKNIAFLAFVLSLIFVISSCGASEGELGTESDSHAKKESSDESSLTGENVLQIAKDLVKMDYYVASLCVGDAFRENLSDEKNGSYTKVLNSFMDFDMLMALFDITYTESSGVKEEYLEFPKYGDKRLMNNNGELYVSMAYSETVEKPNIDEISVTDGNSDNVKCINVGDETILMQKAETNSEWKLCDSAYLKSVSDETYDIKAEGMGAGTAAFLKGNIMCVSIFVDERDSSFDDLNSAREKLDTVVSFLSSQSTELTIETLELRLVINDAMSLTKEEPYELDLYFASNTVYASLGAYVESNFEVSDYDGYFVVVCFNKSGASHIYKHGELDTSLFSTERLIMFSETSQVDIARSILELFGADGGTTETNKKLLREYFPNDIFFTASGLGGAALSEYTKYKAGISSHLTRQLRPLI